MMSNTYLHEACGTGMNCANNSGKFKIVDVSRPTWVESTQVTAENDHRVPTSADGAANRRDSAFMNIFK